jgi:hypothetical protein
MQAENNEDVRYGGASHVKKPGNGRPEKSSALRAPKFHISTITVLIALATLAYPVV